MSDLSGMSDPAGLYAWFAWIRHRDIPAYLARGWTLASNLDRPCHHHAHGWLLRAPDGRGG